MCIEFWCGNVKGRGQLEYEDYIQTGVEEIKVEGIDRIDLAEHTYGQWHAAVNTKVNLRVPYNAGNFLTRRETTSF